MGRGRGRGGGVVPALVGGFRINASRVQATPLRSLAGSGGPGEGPAPDVRGPSASASDSPPTPPLCHPAEQSCMGNNLPDITSRGFSAWLLSSQLSHRSLDHPQSPRPAQERRLVVAHVEARLRRAGAVGPDGSQSAAEDQLWYVRSSASRHAQLIPVLTRETRRSTAPCELRRRPPPWRQRASSGQRALHIVFGRPRWRDLCLGSASGSPECAAP